MSESDELDRVVRELEQEHKARDKKNRRRNHRKAKEISEGQLARELEQELGRAFDRMFGRG